MAWGLGWENSKPAGPKTIFFWILRGAPPKQSQKIKFCFSISLPPMVWGPGAEKNAPEEMRVFSSLGLIAWKPTSVFEQSCFFQKSAPTCQAEPPFDCCLKCLGAGRAQNNFWKVCVDSSRITVVGHEAGDKGYPMGGDEWLHCNPRGIGMAHVWGCVESSRITVVGHAAGDRGYPMGGDEWLHCNPRGIGMVHVWGCVESSRIIVVGHAAGDRGYPMGGDGWGFSFFSGIVKV